MKDAEGGGEVSGDDTQGDEDTTDEVDPDDTQADEDESKAPKKQ